MLGQLVRLRPSQCYAGCLGVVVAEVPKGHHREPVYEVYIEGLGTVVRGSLSLQKMGDKELGEPGFVFITPEEWLLTAGARASRKALLAAVKMGDNKQAVKYATLAADAELRLEALGAI